MWTGLIRSARAVAEGAFMMGNLACEFHAFHYLRSNRIGDGGGSSSESQEMTHEHTFPIQHLVTRRHDPVDAQPGNPDAGAFAQHAGAAGAQHRRLRVRACAVGREQRRQDALPDPLAASAPELAAPASALTPHRLLGPKRRTAMIHPSVFLRRAILADAVFSGVSALLLAFGAGALVPGLDLPEALLRETGLFLIAYAALVGWLGTRQSMPKALVGIVIAGNAAWTIASIRLLFSGAVNPNLLGEVFVATQAIVVGALAELQYIGLRRSGGARGA